MLRRIRLAAVLIASIPAHAAPPPDATGQYREWFRTLTVPGSPGITCCTVADCRMVVSRWNDRTGHFEAKVMRDAFGNAQAGSPQDGSDHGVHDKARYVWMWNWASRFGDSPEVWVEIPEAKINRVANPTGHSVLCWSAFRPEFSGVLCFIPYEGT
jgi:hypothetical protein